PPGGRALRAALRAGCRPADAISFHLQPGAGRLAAGRPAGRLRTGRARESRADGDGTSGRAGGACRGGRAPNRRARMNRVLAGAFDPGSRISVDSIGSRARVAGPLRLACGGPPVATTRPLCVLDGHLDNAGEIRDKLGGVAAGVPVGELLATAYRRWR